MDREETNNDVQCASSWWRSHGLGCAWPLLPLGVVLGCASVPLQPLETVEVRPHGELVVFHDVALFDGLSPALKTHQDIVVRGDVIAQLKPTGTLPPKGATVIEGQGRTLMPGLVDTHVHFTSSASPPWAEREVRVAHNLETYLRVGTTTILDLGGVPSQVSKWRGLVEDGAVLGPRIRMAGTAITARRGYPVSTMEVMLPPLLGWMLADFWLARVTSPAEATAAVDRLADSGVDVIKLYHADTPAHAQVLSARSLRAVVEAAHRRGLPVFCHADTPQRAIEAVRAGVDVLAHNVHLGEIDPAFAAELARDRVAVIPTLTTFDRVLAMRYETLHFSALEKATESEKTLAAFSKERASAWTVPPAMDAWLANLRQSDAARTTTNVTLLHDAGVPLLIGTDSNGAPGSYPGAIHDEMARLVHAGIPVAEVLFGVTSRAARAIERHPNYGSIQVGKAADLLLLDGNPLVEIRATERIVLVMHAGQVLEPLPTRSPSLP